MVSSRQQLGADPGVLLTFTGHGQQGLFVAVPNSGERPSPTAPPLEAEPPPQYPSDPAVWRVEPPPPYSEVEPPPPYS